MDAGRNNRDVFRKQSHYRHRGPTIRSIIPRRISRIVGRSGKTSKFAASWLMLTGFGLVSGFEFPSSMEYLWIPSFLVGLSFGAYLGYRVWKHAMNASSVESAWSLRIKMTTGLFVTAFLAIYMFIGSVAADFSGFQFGGVFAPSTSALSASYFYLAIFIFLVPICFGFLSGESYLLYRLRHHYTISRW
jgi:hypothetical protein